MYQLIRSIPLFNAWIRGSYQKVLKKNHWEKGQGLVEYALIVILVALVVIVILALLGPQISRVFGTISCALEGPIDMMDCFETPVPPVPPATPEPEPPL